GDDKLSRGSGLFVGETGIVTNHHFNPLPGSAFSTFSTGNYKLEIFATLPGQPSPIHVYTVKLSAPDLSEQVVHQNQAIWFEWQPDRHDYHAHLESKPRPRIEAM